MGKKAYNYIHDLIGNSIYKQKDTMKQEINDSDNPAYRYYKLNDIRDLDYKITQAANTLESEDASAGEKANARRILERFKKEYSTAQL